MENVNQLSQKHLHSLKKRFFRNIEKITESGCWIYTGALDTCGYGQISYASGIKDGAHRVSYMLNKGGIPKGLMICHHCDVRSCCNPYHLFLGDAKTNAEDRIKKARKNTIFSGSTGPVHTNGEKIDKETYILMRALRMCGCTVKDLSMQFLMAEMWVAYIVGNIKDPLPS